ncbi:AbrB/MazE/SpoVT family DNA-binding domain-containing protein [Paenibacillus sp. LMG 31459]|uniref:AbrB/MazE/SpoVT family DNA-binding domain-containing protein n=1 Tax=Paenibacillus phytohabitans TaxID=2654978 RepID=A0ABX1Y9D7_9BACL|nr:AbrB/MazE/SpoVT family DNA-binding domain-containing protein [Paenibacillus phytohabitans]
MDYRLEKDVIFMTTAILSKWGNSSAVRIPSQIIKRLNLEDGAELEIILTPENHILLRPATPPQESSEQLRDHLKMLLSKVKPEHRQEELEWGTEGEELI